MEKKEKKADLKQLLNSLVKKGWKPYGIPRVKNASLLNRYVSFSKRTILGLEIFEYTLRSLVSKESGLWQFCCENGMVDGVNRWTLNARQKSIYDKYITSEKEYTPKMNYEYRLIESALKDESELEDFLLSNIKVYG